MFDARELKHISESVSRNTGHNGERHLLTAMEFMQESQKIFYRNNPFETQTLP
jgi:hypothetical protein